SGEGARLVVAPGALAAPVQADRNERVDLGAACQVARQTGRDEAAELRGEAGFVAVLQPVDRLAQRSLVRSRRREQHRAEPPDDRLRRAPAGDAIPASAP